MPYKLRAFLNKYIQISQKRIDLSALLLASLPSGNITNDFTKFL
jgi:hypothetical protein